MGLGQSRRFNPVSTNENAIICAVCRREKPKTALDVALDGQEVCQLCHLKIEKRSREEFIKRVQGYRKE